MLASNPIIYVVDDDTEILKSTKTLFGCECWEVVCLTSAKEFLDIYASDSPGCLVLDLQLPVMDGLELQRVLGGWDVDIPVIFITGAGSVSQSVEALKAGAVDFIEKPFKRETLLAVVRQALLGQAEERKNKQSLEAANQRFTELTEREWQVLSLLISGPQVLSSKEVARSLNISHRTVEHHRASIMAKTQCRSLPELIRLAIYIDIANPSLTMNN